MWHPKNFHSQSKQGLIAVFTYYPALLVALWFLEVYEHSQKLEPKKRIISLRNDSSAIWYEISNFNLNPSNWSTTPVYQSMHLHAWLSRLEPYAPSRGEWGRMSVPLGHIWTVDLHTCHHRLEILSCLRNVIQWWCLLRDSCPLCPRGVNRACLSLYTTKWHLLLQHKYVLLKVFIYVGKIYTNACNMCCLKWRCKDLLQHLFMRW